MRVYCPHNTTYVPRSGLTQHYELRDLNMATTKKTPAKTAATPPKPEPTATEEAKSRFNAALEEAKAGAAALVDDAKAKATARSEEAKANAQTWSTDAKVKADEARVKAGELAVEGKHQASEALVSLSTMIEENAAKLDEKFGAQYGDYARNASKSLRDTARTLDEKSYEELGEDAREAIRKSPATAVGIAALAGFFVARLFRR